LEGRLSIFSPLHISRPEPQRISTVSGVGYLREKFPGTLGSYPHQIINLLEAKT